MSLEHKRGKYNSQNIIQWFIQVKHALLTYVDIVLKKKIHSIQYFYTKIS